MNDEFECQTKEAQRTARLCRVVERVAVSVLEEMGADEVLRHCDVLAVTPGASRARLVFEVGLRLSGQAPGLLDVYRALEGSRGRMRSEVARAINRKRAPLLEFKVVPLAVAGIDEAG